MCISAFRESSEEAESRVCGEEITYLFVTQE